MSGAAQLALDLGHRPALGRGDFLVAPSNAEAVAWIDRWPDWPGPCLVLYGPEGSGKTHLAQVWRARSAAGLIAAGALSSAVDDAMAARAGGWVIEDAEQAGDSPLFHLFNAVVENGGFLLLTARRPPARWSGRLPDLLSRLRAAQTVALLPPDDALMAALLVKQFADRQIKVNEDVVAYLVARIERSFAAAGRTVDAIDRAALARKRPVTVPFVRELLEKGD